MHPGAHVIVSGTAVSHFAQDSQQKQLASSSEVVELGQLKVGQGVLCYDNIFKQAARVKIMEVSVAEPGTAGWITVELSDGTSLTTTGDHPVLAWRRNNMMADIILAKDLVPGEHLLTSNCAVQLEVQNVKRLVKDTTRCVRFRVRNSARYSVFVNTMPAVQSTAGFVAVAASDVDEMVVKMKASILTPSKKETPLKRCESLPPALEGAMMSSLLLSEPSDTINSKSLHSMAMVLPGTEGQRAFMPPEVSCDLEAARTPSLGSIFHGSGCAPCESWHRHRSWDPKLSPIRPPDCIHGSLCQFCHIEHTQYNAYKRRARNKKRAMLLQGLKGGVLQSQRYADEGKG
eukprot:TRINITY_DN20575_c0_g1_i2.p1 TRINITY_DN20575_c0_g1~~TRINITY_DN20575_c0_g1_i2.p1  ORF type:complete len:345 (-),score=46.34 TRINITY_DN20575_c0_g1_i2:50-1084(-)